MSLKQRRLKLTPMIGDNGDDEDYTKFHSPRADHGWWWCAPVILGLVFTLGLIGAYVISGIALSSISSVFTTGTSLSPDDTVIIGDTSLPFQRHEASCAVSTRLSENPIPDSPGLGSLRHVVFDAAACSAGGLPYAPPFVGFGCAANVHPPPTGALPSPGAGCPFGTLTFGTIYSTGGAVVPSDERVKEQIQGYNPHDALNVIKRLRPKTYYHTEEYSATIDQPYRYPRHGLISQEVEEVLPGSIRTFGNYTVGEKTYENFKLLKKEDLIVELIGSIQAHDSMIRTLEDTVELLRAQMQT